jgi:hypothetical protein
VDGGSEANNERDYGPDAPSPHRAPDLTVDDFERAQARPRRPRVRRFGLVFIAVLIALIVVLLVFDHRQTPCHLEIIGLGKGANIEQCQR